MVKETHKVKHIKYNETKVQVIRKKTFRIRKDIPRIIRNHIKNKIYKIKSGNLKKRKKQKVREGCTSMKGDGRNCISHISKIDKIIMKLD